MSRAPVSRAERLSAAPEAALSLDGVWDLFPGDGPLEALDGREPRSIDVPGLWEAQGLLELDGVAWYQRRFILDDASRHFTLRFGAVMDSADVHLNGALLGRHEGPFTPFELDPTAALAAGENTLAVRVTDPPISDGEHRRLPHGKQGWANHVFPSPPSLYMTYGGIWQPVTLRRHGPVAVRDVFVNGDPHELAVTVELENVGMQALSARVVLRTLGLERELTAHLDTGSSGELRFDLGARDAARWSPARPALHEASVTVEAVGAVSDSRRTRYGLRTVHVEGTRIEIDGVPYRMRSALVQGFWADSLYAEPGREAIEAEVHAAKAIGLNTLRLHIKAFDPIYLDVCDELGMLLHCDIPVAEPIDHDDLGADTDTARSCVAEARAQVRRDRSHPSVVLWSAMNELCWERREARSGPGYEAFARALVAAIEQEDPTRPVIENDWPEPDPEHVFSTPLLTAHWYGRLHTEYLEQLERQAREWRTVGRPLYVTEFGDWGLPEMPARDPVPFWYQRDEYERALASSPWPGSLNEFARGTQRYQGLADRLQGELFRRHDHLGGFCLTELTDVPHELNGLLDLERRPKPSAVAELKRLNQPALAMLELYAFAIEAGATLRAPLHVANDGPALPGARVEATLGESRAVVELGTLEGHTAVALGEIELKAPGEPAQHELVLSLAAGEWVVSRNSYPLTVLAEPRAELAVCVLGGESTARALAGLGARPGDRGLCVVGERALDAATAGEASARLATGETVLILAQEPAAEAHFPVAATLREVATEWGSSVFHYTTDHDALPTLGRRRVLSVEDASIKPAHELVELEAGFAAETVVAAFKPVPAPLHSTVVGAHPVGSGWIVVCQYRLAERALADDPTARGVLADLVRFAAAHGEQPPPCSRDR